MNDAPFPDLAELVDLWHRLTLDARASLLRIARAKAARSGPDEGTDHG